MLKFLIIFCWLLMMNFSGIACAQNIKVGIVDGQYSAEISCNEDFFAENQITGERTGFTAGKYFLNLENGLLSMGDKILGKKISFHVDENKGLLKVNKNSYTGNIDADIVNRKLMITNSIDLELYLKNVLPSKIMPVWPDEAIKAQVIAARSYAMYMIEQGNLHYDISANDKELAYKGLGKDKLVLNNFVEATDGRYLTDRYGDAVMAVTTSCTGGWTESSADAWGEPIYYLVSVEDYDKDSPDFEWKYVIGTTLFKTLLEQSGYYVGDLKGIRLSSLDKRGNDRTETGRVKYLVVSGSEGSVQISGSELVKILSLNSDFFDLTIETPLPDNLDVPIENYFGMEVGRKEIDIDVKDSSVPVWKNINNHYHMFKGNKDEKIIFTGFGKGSGVGLSIWGAKGMADASPENTYLNILQHFYPGTFLK